ncbi:hypothetical protein EYF80_065387 [Liparis tanakae]|uniref:Uncharacterized protein n=1 Tax=Liparis tanakae TaxID=230148 RepID=A0A4Z2E6U6_9TELE|nr:hypothetical protein EYF80_065387 [Liparis tanakae]
MVFARSWHRGSSGLVQASALRLACGQNQNQNQNHVNPGGAARTGPREERDSPAGNWAAVTSGPPSWIRPDGVNTGS